MRGTTNVTAAVRDILFNALEIEPRAWMTIREIADRIVDPTLDRVRTIKKVACAVANMESRGVVIVTRNACPFLYAMAPDYYRRLVEEERSTIVVFH